MVGYKPVTDNGAALGNMIEELTSTYVPWDPKILKMPIQYTQPSSQQE